MILFSSDFFATISLLRHEDPDSSILQVRQKSETCPALRHQVTLFNFPIKRFRTEALNSRVKVYLLYVTHVIKNHLLRCIRDNLKCPQHFIKSHLWQLTSSKITEKVTIGAQPIKVFFDGVSFVLLMKCALTIWNLI
jgi:hypothetical protein